MALQIVSKSLQNDFVHFDHRSEDFARTEISAGLLSPKAYISPKYFYNSLGSKLFEAICELPEYYPTRTEDLILKKYACDISQSIGIGKILIDLGAGNCKKAANLFSVIQPLQYIPIDISSDFLKETVELLQKKHPQIQMTALAIDFASKLSLPLSIPQDKRVFFYPGSSIGNFKPFEAFDLLKQIRSECASDGSLLIGVDLVKETSVLNQAYNDSLGVTAAFNLNILNHVNQIVGTDFQLKDWKHCAEFNSDLGRIEMHLEAQRDVTVTWGEVERKFSQGERIHTENSYKYTEEKFFKLLRQAGFVQIQTWKDPQSWFLVCHAKVSYEH